VDAGDRLGGVECGGAGRDAVRRKRGLRGVRDRLLRERMGQRVECGVVFEREVHAFVGLDEDEDPLRVCLGGHVTRRVIPSEVPRSFAFPLAFRGAGRSSRDLLLVPVAEGNSRSLTAIRKRRGLVRDDTVVGGRVENNEVRIREARGVALPIAERRHVVGFADHREAEN